MFSIRNSFFLQFKEKLNNEIIELKVVEPDESDTMLKLSATVRCFVCNSKSNVVMTSKKLVGGRRGKPNWNISNFQVHIRIHFKRLTSGNRQSDQQQTGLDAFISTRNQGEKTET